MEPTGSRAKTRSGVGRAKAGFGHELGSLPRQFGEYDVFSQEWSESLYSNGILDRGSQSPSHNSRYYRRKSQLPKHFGFGVL